MALKMPGNTGYVNDYIEGCWQHVTALTSSIERYSGGELWLEEKFSSYIESQEAILKERLGKIQYDIDAIETVSLVLRGDRIEGSIFILLALLMRRHLAKMHLGLKQELDSRELWDDMDTITWVVDAVWIRFVDLKEQFQHQEIADLKLIFEWLSCGLFKKLLAMGQLAPDETFFPSCDSVMTESGTGESTPTADPGSAVETAEPLSEEKLTLAESNPSSKPSEAEMSSAGTWYGFHWTETQKPFLAMVAFNVKCGEREPESDTVTKISGDGVGTDGYSFTLSGTMNSAGDQPAGNFSPSFERIYEDNTWFLYNGIFNPDRETVTGGIQKRERQRLLSIEESPHVGNYELWSFALNAVINDLRRKKPTLSYIRERMIDIRHTLAFMHRDNDDLDPEEQAQYSKLLMKFSVEESAELNKLYQWYARDADLQPAGYSCDGCDGSLVRSRVICLDCVSTDRPESTVDFCSKPECIAKETIPQHTDVQHRPDHMLVRFRDLLLLKDYFGIKRRAGFTLHLARSIYKEPTEEIYLTGRLPESPLATDNLMEEPKSSSNGEANVATPPTIVDDALIPTPISISPAPQFGLPALNTAVVNLQPSTPDPEASSSDGLLSVAVTPVETQVEEDQILSCVICRERIVAPCWSCVTCNGTTWVCDACDRVTNRLSPWDYQNRYRAEVEAMGGRDDGSSHTVFHALVRFVDLESDSTSSATDIVTDAATDPASPAQQSSDSSWEQIEKRIEELVTARFEAVNARFEAVNSHVDKRLDEVEAKLESGLANIERLLNLLAAAGQPKA
ncbi:VPS13 domain-containing protein [Mycena sanguinolenta]|uniref:VPS13 domain-containing protein n=1 Tax=Mycena sanguinolenta TaxID=230812 RepID=A0A8H6ZHJ1_9AGAR|nr:VPS13 domain-containing protein [Mycena sanguinolenta]